MKTYNNQKTKMTVFSGKVVSVSDDRTSVTIETLEYDRDSRTNNKKEFTFASTQPIASDAAPGKLITIVGYEQIDMMAGTSTWMAGYLSCGNESFEFKTLAVVNGNVVYARYNEEKNEDGTAKMTKERTGADGVLIPSKEKSPHFDIGVSTVESDGAGGTRRVLHTMKAYPEPVKDNAGNVIPGQKNFKKIEGLKKAFARFDKVENPMRVTIVTQPGQISTMEREYEGKMQTSTFSNHMGVNSLDIEFLKEMEREQSQGATQNTPAHPAPLPELTPAPAPTPTPIPVPTPAPVASPEPTPYVAPEIVDVPDSELEELFSVE